MRLNYFVIKKLKFKQYPNFLLVMFKIVVSIRTSLVEKDYLSNYGLTVPVSRSHVFS